jgi:uncharacterized protein DUF6186
MSTTRGVIIGIFILCGLLCVLLGLLSRRETSKIPSLADLAGFVMDYRVGRLPVGRVAVYGFWWWVGWHFFAR